MTAERLRDASALLRERAEAATPGPWDAFAKRDDDEYYNARVFGPGPDDWVAEAMPRGQGDSDAAYIATMSPPVALALADWLDATARIVGTGETWTSVPALTLANAILGTTP